MTVQPAYDASDVLQLPGGDTDRDTTHDVVPFQLGENPHVLVAHRPKLALLLDLVGVMTEDTNPVAQAASLQQFIDVVLEKESAAHLHKRLRDPADDLDLDSPGFTMMFQTLVGLWYQGPTGGRSASSRSPARTGKRSTVRKRSQATTR